MPVELFVPGFPESTGLRKLERPPGESAFFQPGDELWDVSKVSEWPYPSGRESVPEDPFGSGSSPAKTKPWQGKWIVWNARSRLFVARGSWNDIVAAQGGLNFEGWAGAIRVTVELERTGKPPCSLTVASRAGEKASMATDQLEVDFEATASEDGSYADIRVFASWPGPKEGKRWHVATAVNTQDNSRQLLAAQGSGESAWKLFLTTRYEHMGGVPRSEARWVEAAGKLLRWDTAIHHGTSFRKPLGPDREVAGFPMNGELMSRFHPVPDLPVIEVPESLKDLAGGPVVDPSEWLKSFGADFSRPGFFAGFDLSRSQILVLGDSTTLDLCEAILEAPYCGPTGSLWISTNEASGGWGLGGRSGEKARIARENESGEEELVFEVEPTVGGSDRLMDLGLKADLVSGDLSRGRVESKLSLQAGRPMEVARQAALDGGVVTMEVTGAVVPFKH